jgi:hypothetical protein
MRRKLELDFDFSKQDADVYTPQKSNSFAASSTSSRSKTRRTRQERLGENMNATTISSTTDAYGAFGGIK